MLLRAFAALLLIAMVGLDAPEASAAVGTQAEATSGATLAQRRAARALVGKFRRARRDPGARVAVLAQAMQTSALAVEQICGVIEKEMTPAINNYRERFTRAASGAAGKKYAEADKAEIARLQAEVNALRAEPKLAKERIKQVGDPGMKRLAEIALVAREDVLAASGDLRERRQRMLPLGKLWEEGQGYLSRLTPDTGDESKENATSFEEFLKQEEEIAVRLALPLSQEHRAVLEANERLASKLDPEEAKCVLALNMTRVLLGLNPLLIDLKLTAASRDHSTDMAKLGFFAHESPVAGKKTPWDRAANFGAKASAENIAAGYSTGPSANLGWFHSPGHHKNMLGNHKTVGVGRVGKRWTEMFGRE